MVLALLQRPERELPQKGHRRLNRMYLLELEQDYRISHLQSEPERALRIHQSLLGREMQYRDYPVSNPRNVILQDSGLCTLPLPKCCED